MGEGGRASGSARTAVSEAIAKTPSVSVQLSKSVGAASAQFQKQGTAKAASSTGARHLLTHGNTMGEGGRASGSARTAVSEAIAKTPSVSVQLFKSVGAASAQFQKQGTAVSSRNVMPEKSSGPELGAIDRMPKL
jgi:outer membrane lipoprotein SlyB